MDTVNLKKDNVMTGIMDMESKGQNISECLTCGICNSRCTWYEGPGGPVPRKIVRMALMGMYDVLKNSSMIWDCHVCNRCTHECPMGIDMEQVVRKVRNMAFKGGLLPGDIKAGIERRLTTGDVNGLTKEDFVDTVEWLSEEFSDDLEDPDAKIVYDLKNAHYLYLPNPRELGVDPLHMLAMGKLFHAFGETWTLSSRHTDVTNWGYFVGDEETSRRMVLQVVEGAEDLGINTLVLSECGHGTHVLIKIIEEIIGRKPGISIITMPELALQKVEEGVIKLNRDSHPYPIAYHDPCNLGRKTGIYDAPRKLLEQCCKEVVELEANREHSVCCGGGGGLLQDSTSTERRMIAGRAKALQMKATGLEHIATACLSCHRQLGELAKHYEIKMDVKTVADIAVEAMVED